MFIWLYLDMSAKKCVVTHLIVLKNCRKAYLEVPLPPQSERLICSVTVWEG